MTGEGWHFVASFGIHGRGRAIVGFKGVFDDFLRLAGTVSVKRAYRQLVEDFLRDRQTLYA